MDVRGDKGTVRYLAEGEISAEFMVGRVSSSDVKVYRFQYTGFLFSSDMCDKAAERGRCVRRW